MIRNLTCKSRRLFFADHAANVSVHRATEVQRILRDGRHGLGAYGETACKNFFDGICKLKSISLALDIFLALREADHLDIQTSSTTFARLLYWIFDKLVSPDRYYHG